MPTVVAIPIVAIRIVVTPNAEILNAVLRSEEPRTAALQIVVIQTAMVLNVAIPISVTPNEVSHDVRIVVTRIAEIRIVVTPTAESAVFQFAVILNAATLNAEIAVTQFAEYQTVAIPISARVATRAPTLFG